MGMYSFGGEVLLAEQILGMIVMVKIVFSSIKLKL